MCPVGFAAPRGREPANKRRRLAHALPQPFFVTFGKGAKWACVGAALLVRCETVEGSAICSWRVAHSPVFSTPFPLANNMAEYRGVISRLLPGVERVLHAQTPVAVGGTLNDHMGGLTPATWRTILLDDRFRRDWMEDESGRRTFTTPLSVAKAAGVTPEEVTAPSTHPATLLEEEADNATDTDPLVMEAPAEPAPPPQALGPETAVQAAIRRMAAHVTPHSLTGHAFEPGAVLSYLKIAASMKASASLPTLLGDVAEMFFGREPAKELVQAWATQVLRLPGLDILRHARMRLDVLSIIYEQRLFLRFDIVRFLIVDSSPQLGWNFQLAREDRLLLPHRIAADICLRADIDLNKHFGTRIMPCSTYGVGKGSAVKHVTNMSHIYMMETEHPTHFKTVRGQVRGTTSDQGTERACNDHCITTLATPPVLPDANNLDSYVWPRSLWMPGHLHIFYNALQECVEEMECYDEFLDSLRDIQTFLIDPKLRRKFLALCLPAEYAWARKLFGSYSATHIDWRWEMLSKVLFKMVPMLDLLARFWDLEKMLSTDASGEKLSSQAINNCSAALKKPFFAELSEMVRVHGAAIETFASRLEGCHCHSEIWTMKARHETKEKLVQEDTGEPYCIWCGRQGAFMAAEGVQQLMKDITEASSERLQKMIGKIHSDEARSKLLGAQALLKMSLKALLKDKLSFWQFGVYRAMGIYYCEQGGDVETSRRIARETVQEYKDAIAAGSLHRTHRVFQQLLGDGLVQLQMERFGNGEGKRLRDFPESYVELQTLSLISLVERRVEQLHSMVKSIGRQMRHILPPYLCSKLREAYTMRLLREDEDFYDLCIRMWRTRRLYALVLRQRFKKSELEGKTNTALLNMIYQCSLEDEYPDMSTQKLQVVRWQAETLDLRKPPVVVEPQSWKISVSFFKHLLEPGLFYSLPTQVFQACEATIHVWERGDIIGRGGDPVEEAQLACLLQPAAFDPDSLDDLTFFRVQSCFPERRSHVLRHHDPASRSVIHVCPCQAHYHGGEVSFSITASDMVPLDALRMAVSTLEMLTSLRSWKQPRFTSELQLLPIRDMERPAATAPLMGASEAPDGVLVPVPAVSALVPHVTDETTSVFLKRCVSLDAWIGEASHVNLSDTGVEEAALVPLVEAGAITLHRQGTEVHVQLNRSCVIWTASVACTPGALTLREVRDVPLLKCSKLDLCLRLFLEGWESDRKVEVWRATDPMKFNFSFARPLSYFAALLSRWLIFDKGYEEIAHNKCDGYYKCLLGLEQSALHLVMDLQSETDMPNAWFMKHLKDRGGGDGDSDDSIEDPGPPPNDWLALQDIDEAPTVPRPKPHRARWLRQLTDIGPGTPTVKVFFDHLSPIGHERGWCPCAATECCKWVDAGMHYTLSDYCSWMYAWHQFLPTDGITDKTSHLAFEPPPERIAQARASLRMDPF